MKTLAIALATAATLLATPAFAQADSAFTGFRVEGHLGYDSVKIDLADAGVDGDFDEGGLLYGVGLGYDYDFGSFVGGIEANLDLSDVKASATDGVDRASIEAGRDIEVSARVGAKVSDAALLYAKAGYTNARVKASATIDGVTESDSANGDGVRLGVGLEYGFGGNTFGKVEYRYSNYEADISRSQVVAGFGFRF